MGRSKRISLSLLGCLLLSLPAYAQISHGGEPLGDPIAPSRSDVPFVRMPSVNEAQLLKEDSLRRGDGEKVLRFAKNLSTDIDIHQRGLRTEARDGRVVHRIGIHSPGARSLSFSFSPYELVPGARLFIYTPEQDRVLGSFTRKNRSSGSRLASVPIPGDRAVIELIEPEGKGGMSELRTERVSHAYRDPFLLREVGRDFGDAGDCNMNVNCPDGKPWRAQKRSVTMIVVNGSRLCSGALVNNTAEDGTPYILTADHCLESATGPPSGWTFIFNYESPSCLDQQGPLDQSVSGSTLRANHEDSDFCLVEMANTPPSSYGVFYAGWDHSGTAPDSSVSIHHPSGDIKKISFDDDQAASGQFGNSIANGEWHIQEWDRNTTTEFASSGAPLFDTQGRIKGQLHGGSAQCGNSVDDFYGKFSVSWDRHSPPDSQLQNWLDPLDTNLTSWPGYDPRVGNFPNDAAITDILSPEADVCSAEEFQASVEIRNQGSQTLDSLELYLVLEGDTLEELQWKDGLASGDYDTVDFALHSLSDTGQLQLLVGTRSPNGQPDPDPSDDSLSLLLHRPPDARRPIMDFQTDCYGSETAWELRNDDGDTLYSRNYGFYPGTGSDPKQGGTQWDHSFCLDQGCYELVLHDDYGDGMSGAQYSGCNVNGSLRIEDASGQLLAKLEAPDFGSDTVLSFCSDSVLVTPPPGEDGVKVFPNPVQGSFRLRIKGDPGTYRLGIYDTRGRRILHRRIEMGRGFMERRVQLPHLRSGGVYLLRVRGPTGTHLKKLFIDR